MCRFERELRALGKRRIGLAELRGAFLRVHPEAQEAPDPRRLLLDALQELQRTGVAELPVRGWDRTGSPALPRTVRLCSVTASRKSRPAESWMPALSFAADERHPKRLADLQAINAFLRAARGRRLVSVPTRERSLHIFGDEKRLDQIRKGEHTMFDRRISLDDLHCFSVAPPLPCESPSVPISGRPILVLENYHSYESFRRWNRDERQYAAVAYGGGNAFRQGVGGLDDLIARVGAESALYVGDLDPAGAEILLGVNERQRAEERTPVLPHCGVYEWLLAHGCRLPLGKAPNPRLVTRLGGVFSASMAIALSSLWAAGERIPQESFGLEQLRGGAASFACADAAQQAPVGT